ncbi:unnamed protein product [Paramecium pentaurelia]|uniref:RING-type domain-containing protein n=1 Tax=Paramecium pentaurelia TaxID=43138 RepID=A0A8S1U942_9CILI|nr:unnamed protein product [Paramecium pentaurelia]
MIMCTLCENQLMKDIVILIQCGHLYHINCYSKYNQQNESKICVNCENENDSIEVRFLIDQTDTIPIQQLNQLKIMRKSILEKREQEIQLTIKNYKFLLLDYYMVICDLQQLIQDKNWQIKHQQLNSKNITDNIFDDQDLLLSFYQQSDYNKKEAYYQNLQDNYNKIYLRKIDYQIISKKIENQDQNIIYFKDICSIQNQDENSYDKNLKCFQFQIFSIQNKLKNFEEQLSLIQSIIKQQTSIDKLCTLCSEKQNTEIVTLTNCGHIYHLKCFEMSNQQTHSCLNCLNNFKTSIIQFQIEDSQQIKILQNKESFRWSLKNLEIRKVQLLNEISNHIKIDKDYSVVIQNLVQYIQKLQNTTKDIQEVSLISQDEQDLGIKYIDNQNFQKFENNILNSKKIYLNQIFKEENQVRESYDQVIYFVDICYPQNHCVNKINQNLQNLISKRLELQQRWEILEEQLEMAENRLVDRYRYRQEQQDRRIGIRRRPPQTETKKLNERLNDLLGYPNKFKLYLNNFEQKDQQSEISNEYSQTDEFF